MVKIEMRPLCLLSKNLRKAEQMSVKLLSSASAQSDKPPDTIRLATYHRGLFPEIIPTRNKLLLYELNTIESNVNLILLYLT